MVYIHVLPPLGILHASRVSPHCVPIEKELSEEHRTINCVADLRREQQRPYSLFPVREAYMNECLSLPNNSKSIRTLS